MKRTWGFLLILAALALVASAAWWLFARSGWRPPTPIKPALPDIAVMTGFDAPQGRVAYEHPLMWSSRAPVEVAEATPEAAPESEIAQLRLMAVLESGGQRVALLQRPDRSVLKIDSAYPEGDWRLDTFDGLVAVFISGAGQRVERPLERAAAATAPARSGGPVGAPPSGGPGGVSSNPNIPNPGRPSAARPNEGPRRVPQASDSARPPSSPTPAVPSRSQPPAAPSGAGTFVPAGT